MADCENRIVGWRRVLLEWSDVPLRAVLAATFILHGSEKLFGGVNGFAGMLTKMGVPAPGVMAWVVVIAEFGGGIALALGLLTRLAALGLMVNMAVAIATIHIHQGFQMHAVNNQPAGWEWQAALFCMALCLFMRGAGPLSLDRLIGCCCKKPDGKPPINADERK
ncbi:MAG TPA: DoxX family protein [Planctomycetota bacterium]|jgi:putative oxidoreductase